MPDPTLLSSEATYLALAAGGDREDLIAAIEDLHTSGDLPDAVSSLVAMLGHRTRMVTDLELTHAGCQGARS